MGALSLKLLGSFVRIILFLCLAFLPISFVHAKSYWLTGALIGAGVGAGAGAGTEAAICSIPEGSCRNKVAGYVGFTLLGAGVGFGVGAAIGSAFKKSDVVQITNSNMADFVPAIIVDTVSNVYGLGVSAAF